MFEIILIIIAFFILLTKIHKVEDRMNTLEKRQSGQAPAQSTSTTSVASSVANVSASVQSPSQTFAPAQPAPVPKPEVVLTPEEREEKWGRILGIVGVLAVLLGVAFFLKYAFSNNLIGVTGRVIIGIIAGAAFISVGQYLREKYRAYSNILIGCGIGLLYLTTFASFAFYNLIGSAMAYGLIIGITGLAVILSIIDNAMVLATIGVVGGFLTPIFLTLQNASLSQVLTYVLILDIGVMITAYVYKWRKLSGIAFVGTWILVFATYSSLYVNTDKFVLCIFLTLYFLSFLASSIFHHVVRKEISDESDLFVIVVNALTYAGSIYALLYHPFQNFMGFFMVIMALLYFAVSYLSFITNKENTRLNLFLPAMAALFLTLAIPAQLDGPWIALAWFVEAIILYVVDYVLKGKNLYAYGAVVFVVSGIYTFVQFGDKVVYGNAFRFMLNERFFIFIAGIITAYILAYTLHLALAQKMELTKGLKNMVTIYFVLAQLASLFIITTEISAMYSNRIASQAEEINVEVNKLNSDYNFIQQSGVASNDMKQADLDRKQEMINEKYRELSSLSASNSNQKNTTIDIVWILYSLIAFAIGFGFKNKSFRTTGLLVMAITAIKFFVDMWSFGPVYRIVTSLAFGVIALIASFVYAKYRNKLHSGITSAMVMLLAVTAGIFGGQCLVSPNIALANTIAVDTNKAAIESSPYRVEINSSSLVQGRPARFIVTPEIQEKSNLTDLRVFTGIGSVVPYMLGHSAYNSGSQVVNLPVTNLSEKNGHLEFILKNTEGGLNHNKLFFTDGSTENFRYSVDVYGSDNSIPLSSGEWRKLSLGAGDGARPQYIFNFYDQGTGQSVSSLDVSYEVSSAKYIKVVLTPLDKDPNATTVGGTQTGSVTFNNGVLAFKPKTVGLQSFDSKGALIVGLNDTVVSKDSTVFENTKTKSTEITVDFPNNGILLNKVFFDIDSTNFYRHVIVQVKNDSTADDKNYYSSFVVPHNDSWQTIGQGSIYSLSKGDGTSIENFSVEFPMVKAGHYKFIVSNQDNEKLAFKSSVKFNSPVLSLTFVPRSSGPFYLYFGGALPTPVYDLDAVLANRSLKESDVSTVSVTGVSSNPTYKAPVGPVIPFSERYPWVFNTVLVLLILFIAVMIFSYVRKVLKQQAGQK